MLSIVLVLRHGFISETESWRAVSALVSHSYDAFGCIREPMLHRIVASVEQEFEKSTVESCSSEVKGESRTAPAGGTYIGTGKRERLAFTRVQYRTHREIYLSFNKFLYNLYIFSFLFIGWFISQIDNVVDFWFSGIYFHILLVIDI